MEDSSDILGGQLNIAHQAASSPWSNLTPTRVLFYSTLITILAFAIHFLAPYYRQFQEKRYRKAMRRRYGIPDNDLRPFSVAFAAAKNAQHERDSEERGLTRRISITQSGSQATALQRHMPARQRQSALISRAQRALGEGALLPSRQPSYVDSRRTSGNTVTASESDYPLNDDPKEAQAANATASNTSYAPVVARRALNPRDYVEPLPTTLRSKHALDDDMELAYEQESKKTRVEGDELIDGDEEAGWHDSDYEMEVDEASPDDGARGSKRLVDPDEDEGFESGRAVGSDRRTRKVSRSKDSEHSHASSLGGMRGKKRDRAEAGSSLGGDESVVTEDEDGRPRVLRRRRVVSNRKTNGHTRGQKRGRDVQSTDSDDETSDSPSKRAVRHKRGKRSVQNEADDTEEEVMISQDPLCGGRCVGEEWEFGGVRYKVGPNGQRLREALIKKSRSRFPMPKDSEHPDRNVHIDVFVEIWLSDEEFQEAKERQELAWQQSPKMELSELGTPEIPESPSKGKNLLWASSSSKDLLAPRRSTPRQPLVSTGSMRINPFSQSHIAPVRRISTVQSIISSIPDSPKLRPSKSYSKWEKQDLEAAAMAKLREKVKQEGDSEPEKQLASTAPTVGLAIVPSSSVVTDDQPATVNLTAAPAPVPAAFPFVKPAASVPPVAPVSKPSTSDLPSLTIPSAPPKAPEPPRPSTVPFPSFGSLIQPAEPPKPTTSTVPAPTTGLFAMNKAAASQIPGSAPPAAQQASQPPTSSAPSFFAKPAVPSSSTAPVSAPSTGFFGVPTAQPAPAAQAAPSLFSFITPAEQAKTSQDKPAEPAPSGPSLLARMSGFGNATQVQPAGVPATLGASPSASMFFKPTTSSPLATASAPPSNTASSTAPADTSAPVKFNFGFNASKPMTNDTAAAPTEASKPAASPFSFNAPPAPSAANPASSNATTEPPKFSFGFNAGGSNNNASKPLTFGGLNAAQNASNNVAAPSVASSAFGIGSSTAAQNGAAAPNPAFSFASGGAFPSTQASNHSSNPFFNNTPTVPVNTSASTSGFGNTNGPASSPFGNVSAASTPAASGPFGGPAAASSSGFGSTTPTAAPFGHGSTTPAGKPPASSMFSNGGASSMFGQGSAAPATPAQPKETPKFSFAPPNGSTTPAGPPPAKFSFSSGTAFGNVKPGTNGISPFGTGAGATKPTPAAFGFGQPTFTFSKPASDSTQ